ncbi:MAG: GIY-YIG nuclease family protein [Balneolaceae bacterium]
MREERSLYVYILTNKHHTVLYTGVTSDLVNRMIQHQNKLIKGFTARYNVNKLVYYEEVGEPEAAIKREKQIKTGSRKRKLELINSINPEWEDLFQQILPH